MIALMLACLAVVSMIIVHVRVRRSSFVDCQRSPSMSRLLTRILAPFVLLMVVVTVMPGSRFALAQAERCFSETGQCSAGRFAGFWEQNGRLAVFGLPDAAAANEPNTDTGR